MKKNNKPIIDICCGGRAFWFDKNNPKVIFNDIRNDGEITLCNGQTINIKPDTQYDFTKLPFKNESFNLVVFDPPHLINKSNKAWMVKKYGTLDKDWQETLKKGYEESIRILKHNGVLIFKWNETQIKTSEIINLFGKEKLLFGHHSGKRSQTQWLVFMK